MTGIWLALKPYLGQALGAFTYMVSEAVLGKTRFGSWLGLAKALVWFIVKTLFGSVTKVVPSSQQQTQRGIAMSGKVGIDQLKAVCILLINGVNVEQEVMADGHVELSEAGLLFKVFPYVGPAFEGLAQVPAQLADLQADEVVELAALVAADLKLTDEAAKAKVLAVIDMAANVVKNVAVLKA